MAKTDFPSVDAYIAAQPHEARATLERVRGIIRDAVPDATETISYQIPCYKLGGRYAVYFAGWKSHYSVYPLTQLVHRSLEGDLAGYEVSKGTVRFPLSEPVPAALIGRIAKLLAAEAFTRLAGEAATQRATSVPPRKSKRKPQKKASKKPSRKTVRKRSSVSRKK